LRAVLRWILCRVFTFQFHGLENVPQGRYIVAANHPGWLETFALAAFLPAERGLRVVAKREVTIAIPWRRWLIQLADAVLPVDPDRGEVGAGIRLAIRQLRGGAAVCIFPEPQPGPGELADKLRPLGRGVAFLARASGSPVVPAGVDDTRELWLSRQIRINLGPPLPPPLTREQEASFLQQVGVRIRALRPPPETPPPGRRWRWLSDLFSDQSEVAVGGDVPQS
jgi:1-acyl-sn-glycerol-3-phosphate acyltransferase